MKKTRSLRVVTGIHCWRSPRKTAAQSRSDGKLFINVNGGGQTQSRTGGQLGSIPIYGQTATVDDDATIPSGGIFDISVGYKVWSDLGVAIGFSTIQRDRCAAGAASVPSPIFFNRPASRHDSREPAERRDRNVVSGADVVRPGHR